MIYLSFQWLNVACKRDLTYSPAVITSYFKGLSGEMQLGIGYTEV